MLFLTLFTTFFAASSVLAAPTAYTRKRDLEALSATEISAFQPFTQFARATYCSNLSTWKCGAACDANPEFQVALAGGDGNAIQQFFVGHNPPDNTIVVAHEGTDPTKILSVVTDAKFILKNVNTTLFPGVSDDVKIHDGFQEAHASTADQILATVQSLMASTGSNNIVTVGHSLGGALALLDGLFLQTQIPGASVKTVTYGQPRVGNQAFADLIDSTLTDLTRITNLNDEVPIVPFEFLGFHHSSGEIHINPGNTFNKCAGQDNADPSCSTGAVPNLLKGSIPNHLGPYDGIQLGTIFC